MRAISVLSLETGTSTRWCLAAAALRRRVKKSAMGSVCMILLPAGFHHARDFPAQRHAAKTDAAHLKLANIAARSAADAAAVALADLGDFCRSCHGLSRPSFAQGNAEAFQQLASLLVVSRRRGQRDVHALDLVHSRVVNLRKDQLVFEPQRVISAAVESV